MYERVHWTIKQSMAYKKAKRAAKVALIRSRLLEESRGLVLEQRTSLQMALYQNSDINWGRSKRILKHFDMHERGTLPITPQMRARITAVADHEKARTGGLLIRERNHDGFSKMDKQIAKLERIKKLLKKD
eukprot:GHVL01008326.1.p1 GENE.GHVL01008326.1~~GHVL01008326.1.p1  ORF type:complete len:131 (+),score=9.51 GHVL01008326.1:27-419(+)